MLPTTAVGSLPLDSQTSLLGLQLHRLPGTLATPSHLDPCIGCWKRGSGEACQRNDMIRRALAFVFALFQEKRGFAREMKKS